MLRSRWLITSTTAKAKGDYRLDYLPRPRHEKVVRVRWLRPGSTIGSEAYCQDPCKIRPVWARSSVYALGQIRRRISVELVGRRLNYHATFLVRAVSCCCRLPLRRRRFQKKIGETATKARDTADNADDEANQGAVVLALVLAGEECARHAIAFDFVWVFWGEAVQKHKVDTSRLVSHPTMV